MEWTAIVRNGQQSGQQNLATKNNAGAGEPNSGRRACGPETLMCFFRSMPWYMMASALFSDVYPERAIYDPLGLGCGHQ